MALKIRRGTDAQRSGVTFDQGEIVWTTDAQNLWVGDGITQGGVPVVGSSVIGYGLSFNNTTKRIELGTVYTDDITESPTAVKKFFTQELAQDAAALLFTTGIHTGVTVQYDDLNGRINLTVDPDDIGITDVVNDTTPQLGGDLDINSNDITGTGNIDITGDVTGLSLNTANITIGSASIISVSGQLALGTSANPLDLTVTPNDKIRVKGIPGPAGLGGAYISVQQQRGTFSVPVTINQGDTLGGLECRPYVGSKYVDGGFLTFRQDDTIPFVPNSDFTASVFTVVPTTATGFINFTDGSLLTFNSKSVLATKIFKSNGLTSTARDALTPEPGMMIYNSTTKKFQGYTEDAGGGNPGWVDLH